MRIWIVALFILGFNLSLSLINASDVFCSLTEKNLSDPNCCQRYNFETNSWYCVYNATWKYGGDPTLVQRAVELNATAKGFGTAWLQAAYDIMTAVPGFVMVVLGTFTSTYTLMVAILGNSESTTLLAVTVQIMLDFLMVYGFIQFFLGRSGKTIE